MIDSPYQTVLVNAFRELYGCDAEHVETVRIVQSANGKPCWIGEVEVFNLSGHPKTGRGYAWAYDKLKKRDIVALLQLPPVTSPKAAVRSALHAQKSRCAAALDSSCRKTA